MSNPVQNIANTSQQQYREQIDAAEASMNSFPAGIHAIASAYSDYSKKSFEDTRLFVEKLKGPSKPAAISWPSRTSLGSPLLILFLCAHTQHCDAAFYRRSLRLAPRQ